MAGEAEEPDYLEYFRKQIKPRDWYSEVQSLNLQKISQWSEKLPNKFQNNLEGLIPNPTFNSELEINPMEISRRTFLEKHISFVEENLNPMPENTPHFRGISDLTEIMKAIDRVARKLSRDAIVQTVPLKAGFLIDDNDGARRLKGSAGFMTTAIHNTNFNTDFEPYVIEALDEPNTQN